MKDTHAQTNIPTQWVYTPTEVKLQSTAHTAHTPLPPHTHTFSFWFWGLSKAHFSLHCSQTTGAPYFFSEDKHLQPTTSPASQHSEQHLKQNYTTRCAYTAQLCPTLHTCALGRQQSAYNSCIAWAAPEMGHLNMSPNPNLNPHPILPL